MKLRMKPQCRLPQKIWVHGILSHYIPWHALTTPSKIAGILCSRYARVDGADLIGSLSSSQEAQQVKEYPQCYQSSPDDSQQLHHSCAHCPWSPKCLHSRTNQWSRNADLLGWFCVSRHLLFVICFLSLIQFDSGGKSRAPVIQDDTDWNMMQVQLHEQVRRTKGRLNTITVSFNLDTMEGFKNHRQVSI